MNTLLAENGLQSLRAIFAAATHDASAAMCRWTDGLITLTLDDLLEVPLDQAPSALGMGDSPMTVVVLSHRGPLGGELLVFFEEANARQLAASLLGRPLNADYPRSELENSAITETANILACAYFNALTCLLDQEMVPSAPCLVQDFGASVLEQALLAQAGHTDRVLVCRTGFQCHGQDVSWQVVFIPSMGLRQAMLEALGRHSTLP